MLRARAYTHVVRVFASLVSSCAISARWTSRVRPSCVLSVHRACVCVSEPFSNWCSNHLPHNVFRYSAVVVLLPFVSFVRSFRFRWPLRRRRLVCVTQMILAPMVRAGTTPLRVLSLQYGADTVFTEEIIDHKLLSVSRRTNDELGTVDFFIERPGKKGKPPVRTLILRIDPAVEQGRLVIQVRHANITQQRTMTHGCQRFNQRTNQPTNQPTN